MLAFAPTASLNRTVIVARLELLFLTRSGSRNSAIQPIASAGEEAGEYTIPEAIEKIEGEIKLSAARVDPAW